MLVKADGRMRCVGMTVLTTVTLAVLAVLTVGTAGATGPSCPNEAVRGAQRAGRLGDCRGLEMVSAVDKNGGDVIVDPARVRVADDGGAVQYSSLSQFGDSVGGGIAVDYMAVLSGGGQGWVTHGIIPPQPALTYQEVTTGFEPRYEQDLSPDLNKGVLLAPGPLTSDPLVANVVNLYLRDDLLTAGAGDYKLVSGCPLCLGPLGPESEPLVPFMVASTPDLSKVLFQSELDLAKGAVGGATKLYEWDEASGRVTLAGVLPDGKGALESVAGVGSIGLHEHRHSISNDGRRVFFMASPTGVNNVYMRLDGSSTVQLNKSEATSPEAPKSAHYGDASADGSRVFLTSGERLTNEAPEGGGVYMYDTTKTEDNLTFIAPGSAIIGTSADGHIVYFISGDGIYVWHDGEITFLADGPSFGLVFKGSFPPTARVSPSGDLTFLSEEPTAANPAGSCPRTQTHACGLLYEYSVGSHRLACVSCSPSGTPPMAGVEVIFVVSGGGETLNGHQNRVVTDDGQRVFFNSVDSLLPEDVNGKIDAYEWEHVGNGGCESSSEAYSPASGGCLYLLSSGHSTDDSYYLESGPNGDDALFATREQLVGWDQDTSYDIYDARVNGGFPEPLVPQPGCSGEDCRHTTAISAPVLGPPASELVYSAGNQTQHNNKPHAKKKCKTSKRRHAKKVCVRHKARRPAHAVARHTGRRSG